MACGSSPPLLTELTDLVNQIGGGGCDSGCGPCCGNGPCCLPPCNFPYAHVTMTVPPPILAPIYPQPVKPLAIRCPAPCDDGPSLEERLETREDNFYNGYNIDWRDKECGPGPYTCDNFPPKKCGQTVDGKSPCCDCPKPKCCPLPGCPTGFKPCTMKLCPPPCCHPMLPWCAEIQPCPPSEQKKKKKKKGGCSGSCN